MKCLRGHPFSSPPSSPALSLPLPLRPISSSTSSTLHNATTTITFTHLSLFSQEQETPESTFLSTLRSSSKSLSISSTTAHHSRAIKSGITQFTQVGNQVLNLYVKNGLLVDAHQLFDEISKRNVITWTVLIAGYSRCGSFSAALRVFSDMVSCGEGNAIPNQFTLASAFRCCAGVGSVRIGREVHGWTVRNEVGSDVVMENSIVDFYAKCGDFESARRVFDGMVERNVESWNALIGAHLAIRDARGSVELFRRLPFRDVVSWNTIISGQMQSGFGDIALELLYQMVADGVEFNEFTFSMALGLGGNLAFLELSRQLHGKILRSGFGLHVFIRNSLIDMYCKCGMMEYASLVFRNMPWFNDKLQSYLVSNVQVMAKTISWSSMVAGYVQNGRGEEALYLFKRMFNEHVELDQFTLTSITAACSDAGILQQGKQVHACIEKLGHGFDVFLASAIIDMYSKCGSLEEAKAIFHSTKFRNVVLWTSIVGGFALYGQARDAIQLFEAMLKENVRPNEVSFVGVLSACSHAGLVEEGHKYFRSMQEDYGLTPKAEHYTCLVDLLGRAGLLDEAKNFIISNNITHLRSACSALLSACRIHNNVEMAKWVAKQLIQLEPSDPNSYILLSNIYSKKRQWIEAYRVRSLMQEKGAVNQPGQSWIQLKNRVHVFVAGEQSHPQMEQINSYLEKLIEKLKEMGYKKDTSLILHDVEEEERETILSHHSEKLAVAFGIINTPCGTPIRVMKNLRVCTDCHTAMKYISRETIREIVLRDAYRFHRFKHGVCSCGDFW